jgi:hypothetical protein
MNIEKIQTEFDEAVEIRKELNTVHSKDYRNLSTLFSAIFGESSSTLKLLSDINYYRGGYPAESSPPKISSFIDKLGTIIKFYSHIDRLDEINNLLSVHGFKIEKIDQDFSNIIADRSALDANKRMTKITNNVMKRFDFQFNENTKEMIEWFLNQTYALQRVICTEADKIKIDIMVSVEKKLEEESEKINKSGFIRAVNSIANKKIKEENKKDTNPLIEKALSQSEMLVNNGEFLRDRILNS